MPDYKVITAEHKKPVTTDKGEFQVIALTLDVDGKIEGADWFTKASTVVPAQGSVLSGTLEDSPYGKKFRKQQAFGGGGPRPEDPRRAAMILRQHSQHMALMYAALRQSQGHLPPDFSLTDLGKVADWFDADARRAGDAA